MVQRTVQARRTSAALGDVRRFRICRLGVLPTLVAAERRSRGFGLVNRVALVDGRAGVLVVGSQAAVVDVDAIGYRTTRGAYNIDTFGAVQCTAREAYATAIRGCDGGVVSRN